MARPITITLLGDESDLANSLERSATDVSRFADEVEQSLRQATAQAGGLGDAVSDGLADAGHEVSSFGERFKGAAVLAGAAIAGGLAAGLTEALAQEKSNDLLAAQLGASPAEAQRLGKAAGEIYSSGWGESVEDANASLKALWREGLVPAGATADELANIGKRAMDVADVLGEEVGPTANAAGNMIKAGLAKNAEEAFDIMARGAQTGANKAEDLADVFNEYSTNFRTMGLDGATAMGLVSQGLQGGARDADKVADAIKEFSLVASQGGAAVEETFSSIGLNGSQIVKDVAAGGDSAKAAMDKVLDALRQMPASAERASAVKTLFGGPGEDLGAALFSLNVDTAAKSLGKVAGAAKAAGDTMHDNAATKLSAFWRSLQQGAVDVLGGAVLPALDDLIGASVAVGRFIAENKVPITAVAGVITVLLLPALIAWGITATQSAMANGIAWATSTATATTSAASQALAYWSVVGGWLRAGGQAAISAAIVVGGWIAMGAQALVQAARMAAAWLVAMGPVALVIAAVVGIAALIWANWDKVINWTTQAWDWVWNKIKQVVAFLVNLFLTLTLVGLIVQHWDEIKDATGAAWDWVADKIDAALAWLGNALLNFTGAGFLIKHWDEIKDATGRAFEDVKEKARNGVNAVVGFFASLPGRIGQAAGGVARAALGIGGNVVNGLKNGLSRLGGFASSLGSAVTGAAKGAINHVVDLLNWAIPDRLGWGPLSIDLPDNPIPHVRAMGGPAQGLTRVGERGPEWVSLPSGSTVIPNHAAPAAGGVVVNVRSQADPWTIGREVAWALRTT
ncbi:phage tail tape measure protein [Streptomyces catenulae]|uniref:Phage tail tape measure protein n=1 Tax=Streptomyces catenulae TaxID=66875 RepID=A0ABV2Z6I3_9ACTN|nr:phage tail tape measure protein [Streptomyces catenulae]